MPSRKRRKIEFQAASGKPPSRKQSRSITGETMMNLPRRSLADYVASVISPVLIMTLVGSLVFFLVEVLYVGQYQDRVLWFFFFFVFGAVLVSRMSLLAATANRAGLYAIVLGALMWLALQMFLKFPEGSFAAEASWAINLGLILLLWWSSHRLTVDSTIVDDRTDVSGRGLMDAAGLAARDQPPREETAAEEEKETREEEEPDCRTERASGLILWWERFQKYCAEQKERPRTHGVWVVYFSLAALPLFGLGQALIPAEQGGRRLYAFLLLAIYLASGLGLLLTTSFLSLRRYLARRKVQMPVVMTGTWLLFGLGLIALFLFLGALLPRPNAEYSALEQVFPTTSPKRDASQWAFKGDGKPGEGEGRPQAGDKGKEGNTSSGKGKGSGKGDRGQGGGKDGQNSGQRGQANKSQSQGNQKGQGDSRSDKSSSSSSQKGQSNDKSGQGQKSDRQANQGQRQDGGKADQKDGRGQQQENNQSSATGAQSTPPPPSALNFAFLDGLKPILASLKWIVLGVIVLFVVVFLLRALLSFLANFTGWAKALLDWWQALWNALWRCRRETERPAIAEKTDERLRGRPFNNYRNPFESGRARRMSPVELVRYSFEALEAWAAEHDLGRAEDETPLEFTNRIGAAVPELARDVRKLVGHYAAAAYGDSFSGEDCEHGLRQFWRTLTGVAAGAMIGAGGDQGS
jgi:hypothetical protein